MWLVWHGCLSARLPARPSFLPARGSFTTLRVKFGSTARSIETEFPELTKFYRVHIQEHQHLRTSAGRAEVVLAPGSIIRIGEKSQVQMLSSSIPRGEAQAK